MFDSIFETLKANQPVSTTGIFSHAYYWATSSSSDRFYINPSFKEAENNPLSTAIYFIHGTADFPAAFERVATRLIQEGIPEEVSSLHLVHFNQRYQGKSIEFFARQLEEKIRTNHHKRVCFIAHSRGGLVAAYFAEYLSQSAEIEVSLVIPVGSPFNGSYLALQPLSWFSDSVREMEINSEFLVALKKKILENSNTKYHFFIAESDAIVPGKSGYIQEYVDKHPEALSTLDRHGHLSITSSHRLVSKIVELLYRQFNKSTNDAENTITSELASFTLIEDYCPETPTKSPY